MRPVADLQRELIRVRAQGWALADEELAPGVRSVAAPVRDGTGAVRAAMNVTVHAAETSTEKLLDDYLPLLLRDRRPGQWRLGAVAVPSARPAGLTDPGGGVNAAQPDGTAARPMMNYRAHPARCGWDAIGGGMPESLG